MTADTSDTLVGNSSRSMTMETITSRSFQISYQRLEIPVVVKAKSRTLGTWYPKGTEPDHGTGLEMQALLRQRDDAIAEAHALRRKIEGVATKPAANVRASAKPPPPAQVMVGTASYSSRPFTPAPKGK